MKPLSDLLHRMPWWALVLGGFAVIAALGVFVTPFHLIEYRKDGATPEENKAIKREIDNTFAEGALDVSKSAILALRNATSDPLRRAELDRAVEELGRARIELRDVGREVQNAKSEAVRDAREAAREAAHEAVSAIEEAQRDAADALKEAGLENDKVKQALDQALKSARDAEEEANSALAKDATATKHKRIVIGMGTGKDRPRLDIDISKEPDDAVKGDSKGLADGVPDAGPVPPLPPLPPEVRAEIRRNVSGDLKKIGLGAGMVLLFVPIFILVIVAKFFIDRSRAAQRMADLKRKEAEYHLMSRQVTEAKLQALQAQVEPHFLYNTLANVQALTEVDPAKANTMVGHLIQYLRSALPKMRESISTVGQEIDLVRAYLNILQMRMGQRLAFDIDVPDALLATPFPPLMLPSLVENAIQHGLEPQREGGSVHLSAQAVDGKLRVVVADTGRGFAETVGSGVGLTNIRERLAALYGESAKLTLEANSPSGVVATIEVPLDGLRPADAAGVASGVAGSGEAIESAPAAPKSAARKVLSAVGTAERTWRKTLSFAFVGAVVVAAVLAGLAVVATMTGMVPMHIGRETISGTGGALLGAAGIAIAFGAIVIVLAILAALVYGLGWLFLGLAIFIPVVILISTLPATAPFILLGLFIWWLVRLNKKAAPTEAPSAPKSEPKIEPVMTATPAQDTNPGKEPPAI